MMEVKIFDDKVAMGKAAAAAGAAFIRDAIAKRGEATIVVATAPSQNNMYDALVKEDVKWSKVRIFHLDEYIGLKDDHPASFRFNLHKTFLDRLPEKPMEFHPVPGDAADVDAAIAELCKCIGQYKLDVAFIGIGENGHIAFNTPPADFNSPNAYNQVTLDEVCRHQQYGEGWFPTMDAVPRIAISMSVPQIFSARAIINTVPDDRKADAVKAAVEGPVTPMCPASILQTHPNCTLFLDKPAASKLTK